VEQQTAFSYVLLPWLIVNNRHKNINSKSNGGGATAARCEFEWRSSNTRVVLTLRPPWRVSIVDLKIDARLLAV
jgi:hypothetical protein